MNSVPREGLPPRQLKVHRAILSVGGYWRPIAAVARLLEELGELSELLSQPNPALSHISEELADIWIISVCTANQFNLDLDKSRSIARPCTSPLDCFYNLTVFAGQISRAVNYYDGPKNPRTLTDWSSLGPSIRALHDSLFTLAGHLDVNLERAIDDKLGKVSEIDRGRYPESFDPSTAKSLLLFESVRKRTHCPFARTASLWGAPDWNESLALDENIRSILPFFLTFAKAAGPENLDGFVVRVQGSEIEADMSELASWFRNFLIELLKNDPRSDSLVEQNIASVGWQFSFFGVRLFISIFSSIYPTDHIRYAENGTFVVFQPETSFDSHRIGSGFTESEHTKSNIRQLFTEKGMEYPAAIIDARLEAAIYLLPRWENDLSVVWWK